MSHSQESLSESMSAIVFINNALKVDETHLLVLLAKLTSPLFKFEGEDVPCKAK